MFAYSFFFFFDTFTSENIFSARMWRASHERKNSRRANHYPQSWCEKILSMLCDGKFSRLSIAKRNIDEFISSRHRCYCLLISLIDSQDIKGRRAIIPLDRFIIETTKIFFIPPTPIRPIHPQHSSNPIKSSKQSANLFGVEKSDRNFFKVEGLSEIWRLFFLFCYFRHY